MKKGLKNILLAGAVTLGLAGGMKAQEHIVNPFVQPNDTSSNWYGSGDVNHDKVVNWNDVSSMESIINGSYAPNLESDNPIEYRTLDRADVNGDGVVNSSDKQVLEDKLNGVIDYLPGEWNKLKTKEERENLHKQRHQFQWDNKLDTIPYIPDTFECDNFGRLNMIDFNGFPEMGYNKATGWRDNQRFNQPQQYVEIFYGESQAHAVTGTMIGDNVEDLNDWDIREINGLKYGTDIPFPENCEVKINYTYVNGNEVQGKNLMSVPIQKFTIENGIPTNTGYENPEVQLIKQRDKTPSVINRNSPIENEVYNENPVLNYSIDEDNFKNAWYSVDGGLTKIALDQNGVKTLDLPNGNYKLIMEANDFFNTTRDSVNFKVEKLVGLENEVLNSNVKVYPNPATDYVNFEYNENKEAQIGIYSMDGREIEKIYDEDGKVNLDVSKYSPGIYLYKYENSHGAKSGKIVVK